MGMTGEDFGAMERNSWRGGRETQVGSVKSRERSWLPREQEHTQTHRREHISQCFIVQLCLDSSPHLSPDFPTLQTHRLFRLFESSFLL